MAQITRGIKAAGGTAFVDDTDALASEVNTDFDNLYNEFNGGIDEDNFSGSIQIPNADLVDIDGTKVVGHSDTAAVAAQVTTPGDSSTLGSNLAADLEEELERLRYRIERNNRYANNAEYMNSSDTMVSLAWPEPPIQGPNIVRNSGFEYGGAFGSGDAPDGWTEIGTLVTSAIEPAAVPGTGTHKRSLAIATDAANDGLSQKMEGLRASTKYLFGVKYFRTSGTISFSTTGALGSPNNYQNISDSDASTTGTQIVQYVVKSDSSGSDITIQIEGTTSTDFNLVEVWFHELNEDSPMVVPHIPGQTVTHGTEDLIPSNANFTTATSATYWENVTELDLAQYIPMHGYRLTYTATVNWKNNDHGAGNFTSTNHAWRIVLDVDGGGYNVVDGPYVFITDGTGVNSLDNSHALTLRYTVEAPSPGSEYSFRVQGGAFYNGTTGVNMAVNYDDTGVSGEQAVSRAWLATERI